MLHALGYLHVDTSEFPLEEPGIQIYGTDAMDAVDQFRSDQGWQTSVAGYVDKRTIDRMWTRLDELGKAHEVRTLFLELARVSR
jgi:hypothetical protein